MCQGHKASPLQPPVILVLINKFPVGIPGPTGPQGASGLSGAVGVTGPQGPQGKPLSMFSSIQCGVLCLILSMRTGMTWNILTYGKTMMLTDSRRYSGSNGGARCARAFGCRWGNRTRRSLRQVYSSLSDNWSLEANLFQIGEI